MYSQNPHGQSIAKLDMFGSFDHMLDLIILTHITALSYVIYDFKMYFLKCFHNTWLNNRLKHQLRDKSRM